MAASSRSFELTNEITSENEYQQILKQLNNPARFNENISRLTELAATKSHADAAFVLGQLYDHHFNGGISMIIPLHIPPAPDRITSYYQINMTGFYSQIEKIKSVDLSQKFLIQAQQKECLADYLLFLSYKRANDHNKCFHHCKKLIDNNPNLITFTQYWENDALVENNVINIALSTMMSLYRAEKNPQLPNWTTSISNSLGRFIPLSFGKEKSLNYLAANMDELFHYAYLYSLNITRKTSSLDINATHLLIKDLIDSLKKAQNPSNSALLNAFLFFTSLASQVDELLKAIPMPNHLAITPMINDIIKYLKESSLLSKVNEIALSQPDVLIDILKQLAPQHVDTILMWIDRTVGLRFKKALNSLIENTVSSIPSTNVDIIVNYHQTLMPVTTKENSIIELGIKLINKTKAALDAIIDVEEYKSPPACESCMDNLKMELDKTANILNKKDPGLTFALEIKALNLLIETSLKKYDEYNFEYRTFTAHVPISGSFYSSSSSSAHSFFTLPANKSFFLFYQVYAQVLQNLSPGESALFQNCLSTYEPEKRNMH